MIVELHSTLARMLVLYFALVGVWGLVLVVRKHHDLPSALRGAGGQRHVSFSMSE